MPIPSKERAGQSKGEDTLKLQVLAWIGKGHDSSFMAYAQQYIVQIRWRFFQEHGIYEWEGKNTYKAAITSAT